MYGIEVTKVEAAGEVESFYQESLYQDIEEMNQFSQKYLVLLFLH